MADNKVEYVGFWGFVWKWWSSLEYEGRGGAFILLLAFLAGLFVTSGVVLTTGLRESNQTNRLRVLAENPELERGRREERQETLKEVRQILESGHVDGIDRANLIDVIEDLAEELR